MSTVIVYSNTFDVPFVFDDKIRIQDNPAIRVIWPLSIPMTNSNRPLGMLSFAANHAIHGLDVWGYHATNLTIHILAGLTLLGIVRRTLSRGELAYRFANSATWLAFTLALLWLVHPLNTQAVTYIVQRLESLMGLLYLLTLYCFVRAQDSSKNCFWYLGSVICCAAGMGVKEVMVTAPVMVLWYHRAFVAPSWTSIFRGSGRYYYPALFSTWGVLVWAMLRSRTEYESGNIGTVQGLTPVSYLLTQASVITHYLRLSVWPYGQCLDYGWPVAQSLGEIVPPLLFIGSLLVATVWAIFHRPAWGFLGGWFFVILAPTSSVVPIVDLAFEQRMYLPLIAVIGLFVFVGHNIVTAALCYFLSSTVIKKLRLSAIVFAALLFSTLTWTRNTTYRSELLLWQDTVSIADTNPRAHTNLGMLLHNHGDGHRAQEHCRRAYELSPKHPDVCTNLGVVLLESGEGDAAVRLHEKALDLDPKNVKALTNLGVALWSKGAHADALKYFHRAVDLSPHSIKAQLNLAKALISQGQPNQAIAHLHIALQIDPNDVAVLFQLAVALERIGRMKEAIQNYKRVVALDPRFAHGQHNLAVVLTSQKNFAEAIQHFLAAVAIDPSLAISYVGLGDALVGRGDLEAAKRAYRKAIEINPDLSDALLRLNAIKSHSSYQER